MCATNGKARRVISDQRFALKVDQTLEIRTCEADLELERMDWIKSSGEARSAPLPLRFIVYSASRLPPVSCDAKLIDQASVNTTGPGGRRREQRSPTSENRDQYRDDDRLAEKTADTKLARNTNEIGRRSSRPTLPRRISSLPSSRPPAARKKRDCRRETPRFTIPRFLPASARGSAGYSLRWRVRVENSHVRRAEIVTREELRSYSPLFDSPFRALPDLELPRGCAS